MQKLLLLLLVLTGCAKSVEPVTGLPIAAIHCPETANIGVPFEIDGSASTDDEGAFRSVAIDVNGEQSADLRGEFTIDYAGVVTAVLSVTDQSGNVAIAACKFEVVGDSIDTPPPPDEPLDVDLTGSFVMVAYDMPRLSGGALSPEEQCALSPAVALVEMSQADRELTMTMTWCHLEMPDVEVDVFGNIEPQVGDIPNSTTALFQPLGPATFTFDGTSFAPPADFFLPVVAGATNREGALPNNDFASNVSDPDDDGHNGVPIFINGDQFNVALRRTVIALSGSVVSSNEIDGSADGAFASTTEISLLDFGVTGVAQPEGTGLPSRFKMIRVDGANGAADFRVNGAVQCADLTERQAELFASLQAPPLPDGCYIPPQASR